MVNSGVRQINAPIEDISRTTSENKTISGSTINGGSIVSDDGVLNLNKMLIGEASKANIEQQNWIEELQHNTDMNDSKHKTTNKTQHQSNSTFVNEKMGDKGGDAIVGKAATIKGNIQANSTDVNQETIDKGDGMGTNVVVNVATDKAKTLIVIETNSFRDNVSNKNELVTEPDNASDINVSEKFSNDVHAIVDEEEGSKGTIFQDDLPHTNAKGNTMITGDKDVAEQSRSPGVNKETSRKDSGAVTKSKPFKVTDQAKVTNVIEATSPNKSDNIVDENATADPKIVYPEGTNLSGTISGVDDDVANKRTSKVGTDEANNGDVRKRIITNGHQVIGGDSAIKTTTDQTKIINISKDDGKKDDDISDKKENNTKHHNNCRTVSQEANVKGNTTANKDERMKQKIYKGNCTNNGAFEGTSVLMFCMTIVACYYNLVVMSM